MLYMLSHSYLLGLYGLDSLFSFVSGFLFTLFVSSFVIVSFSATSSCLLSLPLQDRKTLPVETCLGPRIADVAAKPHHSNEWQ